MILTKAAVHLLDVNIAIALVDDNHVHNSVADQWFDTPGIQWSMCAFTEAGVLRYLTHPTTGGLSVAQATTIMGDFKNQPGYHFQPITSDWHTLTAPFAKRLHGYKQVTDAYLLGIAIREKLVLTTFDKAFLNLAGEHGRHVLVLESD